jgi:Lrp/AsnC family transcriptional regulator, leucine-responsive regulatory protein
MPDKKAKMLLCATSRLILELLRENSRSTISEIATTVGVSRPTVSYHIEQLQKKGFIRRFTIDINPNADLRPAGVRAMFDLRLRRSVCGIIFAFVTDWKEVVSAWSTSGSIDMKILIEAADQQTIETLRDRLARHPEVVSLTTTMILKTWCERISGIYETAPEGYLISRKRELA